MIYRGATAVVLTVLLCLVGAPLAWAQSSAGADDPPSSTTSTTSTTLPEDVTTSTSSTTLPSSTTTTSTKPSTTRPPGTTTTVPGAAIGTLPTIPPELAGDPRAPLLYDPSPDDGGEIPFLQGMFDPGTNQILQAKVAETRAVLEAQQRILTGLQARHGAAKAVADELGGRLDAMGEKSRRAVSSAAAAQRELRDHTVEAFISGSSEEKMSLVRTGDPVQLGIARDLLDTVVDTDSEVVARHRRARAALDTKQAELSDQLAGSQRKVDELDGLITDTLTAILGDTQALQAYESGSQIYVRGFVFPVQGPVEFIDSWGYPRMMGTPSAHWHQGTDIFAPRGTPLVASESGVLDRVGVASLGGNRLWVKGDSGTEYYYAHLTAYAAGIADGVRVNAGDVVGYVGDSGNAKGTPTHCHFEVHPGGGGAVNPYPLLKATYGSRPMVQIVQAPPAPSAPSAPAPALGPAPAPAPAPGTTVPVIAN